MTADCDVVLLAAGKGRRLEQGQCKAGVELLGRPLFLHAFRRFLDHPRVERVVLVVPPEEPESSQVRAAVPDLGPGSKSVYLVPGGERRQDSTFAGLTRLSELGVRGDRIVLVHDAARPVVTAALIDRTVGALDGPAERKQESLPGLDPSTWGTGSAGAIPGLAVRETLKLAVEGRVVMTQPRDNLFAVQTPQAFRFGPLFDAHLRARQHGHDFTDDSALLEWLGMSVRLVEGDAANLKVTYAADLALAEELMSRDQPGVNKEEL